MPQLGAHREGSQYGYAAGSAVDSEEIDKVLRMLAAVQGRPHLNGSRRLALIRRGGPGRLQTWMHCWHLLSLRHKQQRPRLHWKLGTLRLPSLPCPAPRQAFGLPRHPITKHNHRGTVENVEGIHLKKKCVNCVADMRRCMCHHSKTLTHQPALCLLYLKICMLRRPRRVQRWMLAAAAVGLQLLVMGRPQLGRRRAACGQSGSADRSLRLLPHDRKACDAQYMPMKW